MSINITISQDYDEMTGFEDYERVSVSYLVKDESTWPDLLRLFLQGLVSMGYEFNLPIEDIVIKAEEMNREHADFDSESTYHFEVQEDGTFRFKAIDEEE